MTEEEKEEIKIFHLSEESIGKDNRKRKRIRKRTKKRKINAIRLVVSP